MKIQKLDLEGFRGFEKETFDFHPRVNLFIGVNGAGKTSVLDALGILFDVFFRKVTHPYPVFIADDNINHQRF